VPVTLVPTVGAVNGDPVAVPVTGALVYIVPEIEGYKVTLTLKPVDAVQVLVDAVTLYVSVAALALVTVPLTVL
jgi:hypothetical protein